MAGLKSSLVTQDGAAVAAPCILVKVIVEGAAAKASSVIIYDHASAASGTVMARATVPTADTKTIDLSPGVQCLLGVYVDLTDAQSVNVLYKN